MDGTLVAHLVVKTTRLTSLLAYPLRSGRTPRPSQGILLNYFGSGAFTLCCLARVARHLWAFAPTAQASFAYTAPRNLEAKLAGCYRALQINWAALLDTNLIQNKGFY